MGASDFIAIFALIISAGALALELRRWFESGSRIDILILPDVIISGEDSDKVGAIITNKGDRPIILTNIVVCKYDNFFDRIRNKTSFSMTGPIKKNVPASSNYVKLGQNECYIAYIDYQKVFIDFRNNSKLYFGVISTHSHFPFVKKVSKNKSPSIVNIAEADLLSG